LQGLVDRNKTSLKKLVFDITQNDAITGPGRNLGNAVPHRS
jgi:hypothetical protein